MGNQLPKLSVTVMLLAVAIFVSIYVASTIEYSSDVAQLGAFAVLAILNALLVIPLQRLAGFLQREINANSNDPTKDVASNATIEFSQAVSSVLDIESLVEAATKSLNNAMQLSRSGLFMLSGTSLDSIELLYREPNSKHDKTTISLKTDAPLYHRLVQQQETVNFSWGNAKSNGAKGEEHFKKLSIAACAPIIIDRRVMGLLACGAKSNGHTFEANDLHLLYVLAQQAGVGLRNARLVADLEHLNQSMRKLNLTLKTTNEKLERMDAVKSDFVTIASHELRTPLAQLRGYTDMIDSMNEQGLLDKDQTTRLVGNLRKASERMEELIAAMLDVSQLDVDAMDLSFTTTSIETIVKISVEPLADSIQQRRISFTARGLKGLPEIQADLQRMVQAFRNLILNAVKFTPDGGQIEVSANHLTGETEHIEVRITDTGVGIDPQHLDSIFNKFYRAYDPSLHSTGATKFMGAGPGLGLTIARGVIEGHGGTIRAESPGYDLENHPGSTFVIALPVSTPVDARRVLSFDADTVPVSSTD